MFSSLIFKNFTLQGDIGHPVSSEISHLSVGGERWAKPTPNAGQLFSKVFTEWEADRGDPELWMRWAGDGFREKHKEIKGARGDSDAGSEPTKGVEKRAIMMGEGRTSLPPL